MTTHWYIGRAARETGGNWPDVFKAATTPTQGRFAFAVGPFKTQRTANWFAKHPYATFNSMADAERVRQSCIDSSRSINRNGKP